FNVLLGGLGLFLALFGGIGLLSEIFSSELRATSTIIVWVVFAGVFFLGLWLLRVAWAADHKSKIMSRAKKDAIARAEKETQRKSGGKIREEHKTRVNEEQENVDAEGHLEREIDPVINGKESIDDAMQSLNALIGLSRVKEEIRKLIDFIQIQKYRRDQGMKTPVLSLHLVFTGNPGTGKTTVARLVGKIYAALGLLKEGQMIEAMRQDLIGEYIGQTAPKVKAKVEEALDGVLFIDEAYALAPPHMESDFGGEAVSTLIAEMENYRDRLAVIVAGYTDKMNDFVSMNPGIKSRFTRYIEFDDYSPREMLKIFLKFAGDDDYQVSTELRESLLNHFVNVKNNGSKDLGNARYVRNLFGKSTERHAARVLDGNLRDKETLSLLTDEDIDFGLTI
ncbi:MAG: AAA family ATPase, partial [Verrucomicrobia bacterium]|nr:AAA family ATPase [Verrucomicrobiota bacterium]MBU4497860.1 AAA family ATPase [Verrucomicrobiota bacterium]MCG2679321.1 AAA family ATPase [Kiritimatiellia bacterium]